MPRTSLAALAALTLLAACGGGDDAVPGPVGDPPVLTAQPADLSLLVGQEARFAVVATGPAPLTYQWRRDGAAIPGATAPEHVIGHVALADSGARFACLVRNPGGELESRQAALAVRPVPVAPAIATQPASATVLEGQAATFSVTATGTAPLAYQWRRGGVALPGANGASYTTPATTAADHGAVFDVVVGNEAGIVTSAGALLVVVVPAVAPVITLQPANVNVAAGQTATFAVEATGTAPLAYQWYRGTGAIAGATGPTYSRVVNRGDTGSTYQVVVSNEAGSATSRSALLTVLF